MRSSLVALSLLLAVAPAAAHFKLVSPAASLEQELLGDPQKDAPCGGVGTPTNAVTTVRTGSTLTVTISETIFHPGHYRVSLAATEADLPAMPAVTPGTSECGSVPIEANPTLPLLADGELVHTSQFSGQRSFDVELPPGMECDNCVLQVVEFMSNHDAPCFYYHCATVTISDSAPLPPDAGTGVMPDGGGGNPDDNVEGGCCGVGGGDAGGGLLALGVGALFARRRRR